jgi:hypothetical protein
MSAAPRIEAAHVNLIDWITSYIRPRLRVERPVCQKHGVILDEDMRCLACVCGVRPVGQVKL